MGRRRRAHRRRRAAAVPLLLATACLAACGVTIPSDPDGTLDRVRGDELRAGASASGQLVTVEDGEVGGSLAELVEEFAATLDARVEWTTGSEEELVDGLESRDLDLAIGGMTERTPWADRVAVTRAYASVPSSDEPVVLLLPMGENAWQAALETFLDRELER